MFLAGDNFFLGLVVYTFIFWCLGSDRVITIVATLLYAYTLFDKSEYTGKRISPAFRRWRFWRWYRRCYRHRIVITSPLQPGDARRPCIYASSPHGVNAVSFVLTFMVLKGRHVQKLLRPRGKDIVCGVMTLLLRCPGLRELLLPLGCVSVDKATMLHHLLGLRHDLALLPEGTREIAPPSNFQRKKHPGFLQLAYQLEGRVDCAYVYLQNEDRNYCTLGNEWSWRQRMINSCIGFAPTPYAGAFCYHPLTTWIGRRHHYRRGESFDEFCARWYKTCDEQRGEWLKSSQ
jgi:hypothetical protein